MVEDVAAALVGVHERARGRADGERAVVARPIAVEGVEDVEVRRVAGAQHPVGEHVRVRAAALARDRVHALDVLRAELEQHLVHERDAVVLAEAGPDRAEELVVRGVDHRAGHVEQHDLVRRLDHADVLHQRLAVDDGDAGRLERPQDRQLDHVHPERLAEQAALLQLDANLLRDRFGPAFDRAAEGRDPGPRAILAQPRVVELVVPRRRSEVPDDRLVASAGVGRTGSACPSPRCRCGSRSGSGCSPCRSRGARPAPTPPARASHGRAARVRSRSKSTRCSQSTAFVPNALIVIPDP